MTKNTDNTSENPPVPSREQIEHAREFIVREKSKIRPGGKTTINTETMEVRDWHTIEIWDSKSRRYFPIVIGGVWRYETQETRDAVLSALQGKESNA